MFSKKVFTPGPTEVPRAVIDAAASSITYHRSREFKEFHAALIQKLRRIFHTEYYLNILTTSGTGAMEAAIVNFCAPSDKILFINQGRFGARWGSICKAFGLYADEVIVSAGKAVTTDELEQKDLSAYDAILLTHVETSTGTITNLEQITDYIKGSSDALLIVDSITSVGAVEFKMDEWNLDVAISASQKGLMSPPGLSMVAYNEKAMQKLFANDTARYYLDLRKEFKEQKSGLTSWTPAVGTMYGLDKACDLVIDYDIRNWWAKVHGCAEHVRKKGIELGFELFSESPCDSLTALKMPGDLLSGELLNRVKSKYGVQMANGQAEFKDKIFRISHMGDLFMEDFEDLMNVIGEEFNEMKEIDEGR